MRTHIRRLLAAAVIAAPLALLTGAHPALANNYSWMRVASAQTWCVTVPGGVYDHSRVALWTCDLNDVTQTWLVHATTYGGGGWFELATYVKVSGISYCLDLPGDTTAYPTDLQVHPCNGTAAQAWVWADNGNGVTWGNPNGDVIDLYQGTLSDGAHIVNWPYRAGNWTEIWYGP